LTNLNWSSKSKWWSLEEAQTALQQLRTLAAAEASINKQARGLYNWVNWKCFRLDLLEKYGNNELCEIGRNHISFLQEDKQTPASTVSFYHTNIPGGIMLQTEDYISGIPPTERNHWEHNKIPLTFKPIEVE
jgi:hypothetical protein